MWRKHTWAKLVLVGSMLLFGAVILAQQTGLTPQQDAWLRKAQIGPYQPEVEDWDAIYQAAKAEGKVVILSLSSRIYQVVESFKAAYPGIEVEAYDMTDVQQIEKLTREQGAGIYTIDVLFLAGTTTLVKELLPQRLIWNYVPTTLVDGVLATDAIPEEFRSPLLVHSVESKVVFYNFETYPTPPVTSLWDLTRPEWKGRVQFKDPLTTEENMNFLQMVVKNADLMAAAYQATFGTPIVLSPGIPNAGYEWIKRLADNGLVITKSDGDATKACGTPGQAKPPLAIASSSKIRDNEKGQVLAIGWDLSPVAGLSKLNYMSIANLAPHPNAAKLLIQWMLGDGGGGAGYDPFYVKGQWSSRIVARNPLPEITLDTLRARTWFVDPDWVYEHGLQVQDFWLTLR
ncbi:MAG: ABC transporter substrate-binding protein [Candidatus Acetothermia bacterium]|nr:ABC transporter substrate-binding protein [Candidatus Acetothermia bacterium]